MNSPIRHIYAYPYFFNNKFLTDKNVLLMGNPISSFIVHLCHTWNTDSFSPLNTPLNIHFLVRYVNDIFHIRKGAQRQLSIYLIYINSLYPEIKFNCELEFENQFNFLYLTIPLISYILLSLETSKNSISKFT